MSVKGNRVRGLHQVRIIGGKWRGRKLPFTPAEGLRPTGDRIRETLFNWLATSINGARCADLFAGTGALGLEALSRGASHCDFIERSSPTLNQIIEHLKSLQSLETADCHLVPAHQFLKTSRQPYDIVFIDPPFNQQLVEPVCGLLAQRELLSEGALVYIETAATEPTPEVPATWTLYREKVSGGVAYRLFICSGATCSQ